MKVLRAVSEISLVPQLVGRPLLRSVQIQCSVVIWFWVLGLRRLRTKEQPQVERYRLPSTSRRAHARVVVTCYRPLRYHVKKFFTNAIRRGVLRIPDFRLEIGACRAVRKREGCREKP